jgi:hypothetical protein
MTDSCWGDEWRENWQPAYGGPFPTVTPEDFDQAMSEIDVAIVFGMRATAANVATPNQRIADFCKATKTKTIGFMALDPNDEDVLEQMREGLSLGLRGIKLYPVLAHFDPREDRYRAFFEAVVRNDLALLWHMGASPSKRARLELSHPLLVDEVAKMYPKMIQIRGNVRPSSYYERTPMSMRMSLGLGHAHSMAITRSSEPKSGMSSTSFSLVPIIRYGSRVSQLKTFMKLRRFGRELCRL